MAAKGKRGLSKRIKKAAMRRVSGAVERVDFVSLLDRIAASRYGRPWKERFADLPPAWPGQDELAARAAELTMAQLKEEGHRAEASEVREVISQVRCRYDHDIHKDAVPAVTVLMNGLFSQADPMRPFVSLDGRELAQLEKLKAFREQGLGVVYLVNHSSHLDEFLLAMVLAHNELGLPLFAAGANMMAIKSLARVLMVGSYVVQRRGANRQALAGLFNYCRAISETGGQQGIFLEAWHGGARSRDGSLRYPRRLVTLRGALAGQGDLVVQPVAISYSVVPEDLALAARGGARVWTRGMGIWATLGRLAAHPRSWLWRSMQGIYGRASVTLPEPRLLSKLKEQHEAERGDLHLDEFVALSAIRDIARAKKVMASQLTARGLVRARGQGSRDLAAAVQAEREMMSEYHRATYGAEPDFEDLIRDGDPAAVVADGLATLRRRRVLAPLGRDRAGLPRVKSRLGLAFYATHGDRRLYSPTAEKNLVVAGSGDWGFALTHHLGQRLLDDKSPGYSLTLYEPQEEIAQNLAVNRRPEGDFSEVHLPKNAFVTWDAPQAFKKATVTVLACTPDRLAQQARALLEHSEQALKVVAATCGLEPGSGELPVNLVRRLAAELGRGQVEVYSLVGPMRPVQVVEGQAATCLLAGPAAGRAELMDLFSFAELTILESDDAAGVQAATILARIYALWGNVLARLGEVTGAAQTGFYMAAAQAEAARLGQALGGSAESFAGPAFYATFVAEGLAGPTRELGRRIGKAAGRKGEAAAAAAKLYQQHTAQGGKLPAYPDLMLAWRLAQERGIAMPMLERAARILHEL